MKLLPIFLIVGSIWAAPVDGCRALEHHGQKPAAHQCWQPLAQSSDALTRAIALFGLEQYQDANDSFREAETQQPRSALVKTQWGKLFLERSQPGDAGKLFQEAIGLDVKFAPAYLGLARAVAGNYDKTSVELSRKALECDPTFYEAQEFLAYLSLEDGNRGAAEQEANKALALSPEALDAMAVLASLDWLDGKTGSAWIDRAKKINPSYARGYEIGAHFLVINRRYEEGIELYRKAIELDPSLWSAHSQLGLNLMRLGQTTEAQKELKLCFDAHFRDAQTVNALRLLDTLPDYQTVQISGGQLMLNKKEAALLAPYFSDELSRAMATYSRKYQVKLPGPVHVEVFPNHEDFNVRILGLPGQGGLLGVTFGTVVAMDSPSARVAGDFDWAETLWHELSHVYVITATNHLVPRWFAEGVAVHEESASSPINSDRVTPQVLAAIHQNKLLPVVELERGFVRPEYEGQVIVSYFEAGRMCDFIVERWGDAAILGMMHSYASRATTSEAIASNLHVSSEQFDQQFRSWLPAHVPAKPEPPEDWSTVKQRAGNDEQALLRLNYVYLEDPEVHQRLGTLLLKDGKAPDAVREFRAVVALRPDDTAQAHYDLARALSAAHDPAGAKNQVLIALEAAPDFKPAQQLLLKLSQ